MSNVSSTFDKEFNNLANGADMFKDCEWVPALTQSAVSSCCTASNQISQSYNDNCCSIRSNAASIKDVEEVQKNINSLNKILSLISTLVSKDKEEPVYEPMPLYKKFED